MRYRTIPGTDIRVSEVGFGVWSVATEWWGVRDPGLGVSLLREAFELGVNFFDTADAYGDGRGETILAEALAGYRHDVVIGTKVGYDIYAGVPRVGHGERPQKWTSEHIRHACEQSLRRLGTDYIDIYQVHNPRLDTLRSAEVLETLDRLREEGKVRVAGAALGPDVGWFEEGKVAVEETGIRILQVIYNLLEQEPAKDLFPIAEEHGVGCIVRVPHASGLLDGTYDPQAHFAKDDHRNFRRKAWMEAGLEACADLEFLIAGTGRDLAQAAIQFSLSPRAALTVLPNIMNHEDLRRFVAAADAPSLTDEELRRVAEVWTKRREGLLQPFASTATKPTPVASGS